MNWYYVTAGQQAGPVDEAHLPELLRAGTIQPDTLVWHEGMANWQPYRQVAPASAAPLPASPSPIGPLPGAGGYPAPAFPEAPAPGISEPELLAREYHVDIGGCLVRAWELLKQDAGLVIGVSVLVVLALVAVSVLALPLAFIKRVPFLNLLPLLLTAPLMGGLWVFYLRLLRNQQATVAEAFSGFGPRYGHLVLTQLIVAIPTAVLAFLWRLMGFEAFFQTLIQQVLQRLLQHAPVGSLPALPPMLPVRSLVLLLVALVTVFLSTCWWFALPLAADKGLSFWRALEVSRAVVMKHWWMTFWLLAIYAVLIYLGMAFCFVGLLFTGPLAFGMLAAHYQSVFGDLAPANPLR